MLQAYAILAGGGVKRAALAGCLKACTERDVEFAGYGGVSAGAIVATLAAVGNEPEEVLALVSSHFRLADFFEEDFGEAINRIREMRGRTLPQNARHIAWLLRRLSRDLGLYAGKRLRIVLTELIRQKLPRKLKGVQEITFGHLKEANCTPLRFSRQMSTLVCQ
jgi:NTE family protein